MEGRNGCCCDYRFSPLLYTKLVEFWVLEEAKNLVGCVVQMMLKVHKPHLVGLSLVNVRYKL